MSFYSYWLLVNITRRKMGNWKKLKRAILENNVNVQKQPQDVFYKKAVLKNFALFIAKSVLGSLFNKIVATHRSSCWQMFFKVGANFTVKHLCRSLFLIKLQAFRRYPVTYAEFWRAAFYIGHISGCFWAPVFSCEYSVNTYSNNICERLLLNVVFNINEDQHLLIY